jgi:putative salt-induced outer membrane protein YdiY
MRRAACGSVFFFVFSSTTMSPLFAQAPPPAPHKVWTLAASAGLALTSGNADTSNVNAAYDLVFDPQTRNIVKSDALLLRGTTEGDLSADRFNWNIRDQYTVNGRTYVFGQNQYLRDSFKDIDYLLAPTGGIGYKLLNTPETTLDTDLGAGGVWEKNADAVVEGSGAITLGEKLSRKLTSTTTFTQSFAGLWKTKDLDDSLYQFGVGIAAAVSSRVQLKVELLDVYKNKPPTAAVKKNDLATIVAIVYKN